MCRLGRRLWSGGADSVPAYTPPVLGLLVGGRGHSDGSGEQLEVRAAVERRRDAELDAVELRPPEEDAPAHAEDAVGVHAEQLARARRRRRVQQTLLVEQRRAPKVPHVAALVPLPQPR